MNTRVEVTPVTVVVAAAAVSALAYVAYPGLWELLDLSASGLAAGQLWRLFTWPLANVLDLWLILNLVMLWYFGSDLQRNIGQAAMTRLFIGIWIALTGAFLVVTLLLNGRVGLGGIRLVEFSVLLLWIAESPHRRFFFGIPAWAIGGVFIGLQALTLIAERAWLSLATLVLSLAFVAIAARRVGLLSAYPWIPGRRKTRATRPPRAAAKAQRRSASDEERMDQLLGKISAQGIHSLSAAERKELERLRQRRRRG
ncbi:MAG: rhomboid family intramembrane serine protease [Arachnia sp.]